VDDLESIVGAAGSPKQAANDAWTSWLLLSWPPALNRIAALSQSGADPAFRKAPAR